MTALRAHQQLIKSQGSENPDLALKAYFMELTMQKSDQGKLHFQK